jgi:hypothetical protein
VKKLVNATRRWLVMVSRGARITILALVAGAVVALSGSPAQAQPYYNYYGPQPYYGARCQTYWYGGTMYTNCPAPPYTYYYNGPYYAPYYTYYYYGPSRSAGSRER